MIGINVDIFRKVWFVVLILVLARTQECSMNRYLLNAIRYSQVKYDIFLLSHSGLFEFHLKCNPIGGSRLPTFENRMFGND